MRYMMTPRKPGSTGKVHKFLTSAERAALIPLIEDTLHEPKIGSATCQFKPAHSDNTALVGYIKTYGMPEFDVTHVKRFRQSAYGKAEKEIRTEKAPKPASAPVQVPQEFYSVLEMLRAVQMDVAYTKSMMQDFHTRYITDKPDKKD